MVAGGGDGLGVAVAAHGAGVGAHAVLAAGGGGGDRTAIIVGHGTRGAAQVTGGVADIVVLVFAGGGGEVIHRAGGTLIQSQRSTGAGRVAGIAIGAVAAQVGVDTLGLVAHVDELIGAAAGHRPLGKIGNGGQQSRLILGAGAAGISLGGSIVNSPVVAVRGDVPHDVGGRSLNAIVGNGDLGVIQTVGTDPCFHSTVFIDDDVIALGDGAAVLLVGGAVAAAGRFKAGIQRVQDRSGRHRVAAARIQISGNGIGLGDLLLRPAQEGIPIGQGAAVVRQGDGITHVGRLGGGAVEPHELHGGGGLLCEIDADAHVGGGLYLKGVAVAGDGSGSVTAEDGVAADRIATLGSGGDGLAAHRHGAVGGVAAGGGDGKSRRAALAGGRLVVVGDILIEQQERQLGIVHEHVTGAGDGLNDVVTAQFPRIHGVLFDPIQHHSLALNNAGGAKQPAGPPTNVLIQNNTRHVAAQVVGAFAFVIGVIIVGTGLIAVRLITAAGVLTHRGGAQHHNVVFTITGIVALTVGPGMLTIPFVAVPFRTDSRTGVKRRYLAAAVLAIGVFEQILGSLVTGFVTMIALHQFAQLVVQSASLGTGGTGRAGQSRQFGVRGVVVIIPILRHRREEGGQVFPLTPVVDVIAACDVINARGLYRQNDDTAQDADKHHHSGQDRPYPFLSGLHIKPSVYI